MKYEILDQNGNVLNTIIADSSFVSENFEFYREVPEIINPPVTRILTKLEFRNRFSDDEKLAIYSAAENSMPIKIWLDDLNAAQEVDLDYPKLRISLEGMVTDSLLTQERLEEILS